MICVKFRHTQAPEMKSAPKRIGISGRCFYVQIRGWTLLYHHLGYGLSCILKVMCVYVRVVILEAFVFFSRIVVAVCGGIKIVLFVCVNVCLHRFNKGNSIWKTSHFEGVSLLLFKKSKISAGLVVIFRQIPNMCDTRAGGGGGFIHERQQMTMIISPYSTR